MPLACGKLPNDVRMFARIITTGEQEQNTRSVPWTLAVVSTKSLAAPNWPSAGTCRNLGLGTKHAAAHATPSTPKIWKVRPLPAGPS